MSDDRGLRKRKEVKYTYDYGDLSEGVGSDDSDAPIVKPTRKTSVKSSAKKVCPGCGDLCSAATRACKSCDYLFASLPNSEVAGVRDDSDNEADDAITSNTFLPEREANGKPRLDQIIGMRLLDESTKLKPTEGFKTYSSRKYDYEYLCKYKNISYLHLEWMSGVELDELGPKSRSCLSRYLTKLDKGIEVINDSEFDLDNVTVERILDEKEEEVVVEVDADGDELNEFSGKRYRQLIHRQLSNASSIPRQSSTASSVIVADLNESELNDDGYDYDNYSRFLSSAFADSGAYVWAPMFRCRQLWKRIYNDVLSVVFHKPVDLTVFADYRSQVSLPMDLSGIRQRLESNVYKSNPLSFAREMRLVWSNCKSYNECGSWIWKHADILEFMFDRLLDAWIMSFKMDPVDLSNPIARPWELTCRKCEDDDDDDLISCDCCESKWHKKCLNLVVVDGAWLCDRCVGRFSNGHRTISCKTENALRVRVDFDDEFVKKKIVRKRYLVKWSGLSYQYSTWEDEDVISKEVIDAYHDELKKMPLFEAEYNDYVPVKRQYPLLPAMIAPGFRDDIEGQLYAQIRSFHFLHHDMVPPSNLLSHCGPFSHAQAINNDDNRSIVSLVLSEIVFHVSRDSRPSTVAGPPLRPCEYDVCLPQYPGKHIGIGFYPMFNRNKDNFAFVGAIEPCSVAQAIGCIQISDLLIAINGRSIKRIPYTITMSMLRSQKEGPFIYLRFKRTGNFPENDNWNQQRIIWNQKKLLEIHNGKFGASVPAALSFCETGDMHEEFSRIASDPYDTHSSEDDDGDDPKAVKSWAPDRYDDDDAEIDDDDDDDFEDEDDDDDSDDDDPYSRKRKYNRKTTKNKTKKMMKNDVDDDDEDNVPSVGPITRLLRAVSEAENPPHSREWSNFMLDETLGVEKYDLSSGVTVRSYRNIVEASKICSESVPHILGVLNNRITGSLAVGWRYASASIVTAISIVKTYDKSPVFKNDNQLRLYQVDGLNWLLQCYVNHHGSILADEMGLGKTAQILAFLNHLYTVDHESGPFLVTVPLSTIEHWRRETEHWTDLRLCLYHDVDGGREMRDLIRRYEWHWPGRSDDVLKFHLLVTTFDDLMRDVDVLSQVPWKVVVVDEAHRLKNVNSRLLENLTFVLGYGKDSLNYQHRILMTGTPIQNNTQELWSLVSFVAKSSFPTFEQFDERFGVVKTEVQVKELQKLVGPYVLRRVKEDVAKDIPPKEETVIDVELTRTQKQFYRAIYEKNHSFLYQGTKGKAPTLMNVQMELRKICNHPLLISGLEEHQMSLIEESSSDKGNILSRRLEELVVLSSGKMVLLDKLLPKLRQENHKVLIFSQMIRMLDILEEYCHCRRFNIQRLDGRITGTHRQQAIDKFNREADSFIFLLSTRAGGVGINLTSADIVIIYDSDWNPQNDIQAQARCHRIGQTKQVMIYRLVTGRSFETEMFERASKKLGLEQAVLGSMMFGNSVDNEKDKMETQEVEQLLRKGAYGMMDESDENAQQFCESNIDTILEERAHIRVIDPGGQTASWLNKSGPQSSSSSSSLTSSNSVSKRNRHTMRRSLFRTVDELKVDVNDPEFWSKVLPDLKTPVLLEGRLNDDALDENEELASSFIKDVFSMCQTMWQLHLHGQLPENEKNATIQLLFRITLRQDTFDHHQRDACSELLSRFEGSKVRKVRTDKVDSSSSSSRKKAIQYFEDEDEFDNDDEEEASRKKQSKRKGRKKARKGMEVQESDEFVISDVVDDQQEESVEAEVKAKKKKKSRKKNSDSLAVLADTAAQIDDVPKVVKSDKSKRAKAKRAVEVREPEEATKKTRKRRAIKKAVMDDDDDEYGGIASSRNLSDDDDDD